MYLCPFFYLNYFILIFSFYYTVTLYKCPLLGSHGGRADCSLCLTRDRKYQCAWCDGSCKFGDACLDPVATTCPPPRIDWVRSVWILEIFFMFLITNNSIRYSSSMTWRHVFHGLSFFYSLWRHSADEW